MKDKLPLIAAIVLGLIGIVIVNKYIQKKTLPTELRMAKVMAASRSIDLGREIALEDISTADGKTAFVEIPESTLMRDHIRLPEGNTPADLQRAEELRLLMLGRRVRRNIEKNSPVLWSHFEDEAAATLSSKVASSRRAVTVGVDALSAVGFNIVPGDRLDVLVTLQPQLMAFMASGQRASESDMKDIRNIRGQQAEPLTTFLMQDVRVLATGTNFNTGEAGGSKGGYNSITLDVLPSEAVLLTHARRQGSISFILRSPTSNERLSSEELKESSIRDSEIRQKVDALDIIRAQTIEVLQRNKSERSTHIQEPELKP